MINWIDILLLAIIALYAFMGWRRGFILGAIELIAWVGSIVASFLLFPYVSVTVSKIFPALGIWLNFVSFLFTFLVIRLVASFIIGLIMKDVPARVQTSGINKLLGLLPGIINGLISATIVALVLMVLPLSDGFAAQAKNSRVANELTKPANWVEDNISPVIDSAINRTVARLTIEPGTNDFVALHFTTTHYKVREDLEAEMLQLVNEERARRGLRPLLADSALTAAAREHSKDMFERGYFSHITPEGKDPFARMHDDDINFLAAGENLALAQTLRIAHAGLMHSPGHRANILNPAFGKVGIGILDGGIHGLMISQEFSN
jgi:uncharacterized protein YkwD